MLYMARRVASQTPVCYCYTRRRFLTGIHSYTYFI
jgi:hypothetical protein